MADMEKVGMLRQLARNFSVDGGFDGYLRMEAATVDARAPHCNTVVRACAVVNACLQPAPCMVQPWPMPARTHILRGVPERGMWLHRCLRRGLACATPRAVHGVI